LIDRLPPAGPRESMLRSLRRWLCPDLALDLGTSQTQIVVEGRGLVLDEPSVVVLAKGSRKILGQGAAVGRLARTMLGRTPDSLNAACPLQAGAITDFHLCESMLRYFFAKAAPARAGLRPRLVMAVPGAITPVEKRAAFTCAERAGAGEAFLVPVALAAALGAGLPIAEPLASLICDLGGGTTDAAVFSLGDLVARHSLRLGGAALDEAIVRHLREHFALKIGLQTAEQLKHDLGSAAPLDQELSAEVRGRDVAGGVPRRLMLSSTEIRLALRGPLTELLNCVKQVIEQCPPELVADLVDHGLVLTGGGALLRGIDRFFSEELNIPVRVAPDPQTVVVRGAAICLDHLAHWRDALEGLADVA